MADKLFGAGHFPNRKDIDYPDNRIGLSAPMNAGNIASMARSEKNSQDQHSAGAETISRAKQHLEKE